MCCIEKRTKPWTCCCGCSLLCATWFFAIMQALSVISNFSVSIWVGGVYESIILVIYILVLSDAKNVNFRYALYIANLVTLIILSFCLIAILVFVNTNPDIEEVSELIVDDDVSMNDAEIRTALTIWIAILGFIFVFCKSLQVRLFKHAYEEKRLTQDGRINESLINGGASAHHINFGHGYP